MTAMLGPALRMIVSLAVVLALMYVAARLLARSKGVSSGRPRPLRPKRRPLLSAVAGSVTTPKRGRRQPPEDPQLEVLARRPLGKTASVSLVRVADKMLLIGVTDSTVQLLSEIDTARLEEDTPADLVAVAAGVPGISVTERSASGTAISVLDQLRERTVRRA